MQGKLMLVLYPEDFSTEEVSNWLKRNVRHGVISSDEMGQFIDIVVKDLSGKYKHTVEELSLNRFRLKERIQEEIAKIIELFAKNTFDNLDKSDKIGVDEAFYDPGESILISRLSDERFQKHLFERAGIMNGEETEFAMRVDALDNISWWFRSREKEDFYLQGWKPNKFYPDFIIKTESGVYILAEYKGEDRITNEDTQYKVELGEYWQGLTNGKHHFLLVTRKNIDESLGIISNL
jgi:type III restriction enzyme